MESFADRVVIVTGASSGIGRALSLVLAPERPKLVLAARNTSRLEEVAAQCRRLGAETLVAPTDVTSQEQCRALVTTTIDHFGRLDALVNSAGRAMWSRFDELRDLSVIEEVMRVNYLGSAYCTSHALSHLKQSGGLVVGMSSVSGLTGVPMLSGYSASKHAVVGFFESLRIELRASGVGVTIVAPDFVQSEILERSLDSQGKPLEFSPLNQQKMIEAEQCAARIAKAMRRRERLVVISRRAKNILWGKLLMPRLVDRWVAAALGKNLLPRS